MQHNHMRESLCGMTAHDGGGNATTLVPPCWGPRDGMSYDVTLMPPCWALRDGEIEEVVVSCFEDPDMAGVMKPLELSLL